MAYQPTAPRHAAGLVTSEAVALDVEEAGVASRLVARLVDAALLLVVVVSANVVIGLVGTVLFDGPLLFLGPLLFFGLYFLVVLGYPVLFETVLRGRTPGKVLLGLRVVQRGGGPVTFRHAAVRALVGLGEVVATLGLVALVTMFVDRHGRRLGDLAAGTIVVRERVARAAAGTTQSRTFAIPSHLAELAPTVDVSALDARDYALLRATLLRLASLPPQAAADVAAHVATTLAPRVRPARPADVAPAWWLHLLAARVQQRRPATADAPAADGDAADWRPRPPTPRANGDAADSFAAPE